MRSKMAIAESFSPARIVAKAAKEKPIITSKKTRSKSINTVSHDKPSSTASLKMNNVAKTLMTHRQMVSMSTIFLMSGSTSFICSGVKGRLFNEMLLTAEP